MRRFEDLRGRPHPSVFGMFRLSRAVCGTREGTTVVVLAPFVVAWLLVCTVLALSPEVDLHGDDWMRMVAFLGLLGPLDGLDF